MCDDVYLKFRVIKIREQPQQEIAAGKHELLEGQTALKVVYNASSTMLLKHVYGSTAGAMQNPNKIR